MSYGCILPFRNILKAVACLLLMGITWACGTGDRGTNGWEQAKLADPASFQEGDSFPAAKLPPAVSEWLSAYASLDTGMRIHRLRNSGVPLHLGTLEPAGAPQGVPGQGISPFAVFSPDSTRAIDFLSYGMFRDTSREGSVSWKGGEADQEVILLLVPEARRLQLMFNGPQSVMEVAGWITNDACLVGLVQTDEAQQRFYPELMLFNFRDSLFTNFRTAGNFPLDLLLQLPPDVHGGRAPRKIPAHE